MAARPKPFHEPPVQKRHVGYGTALPLVRSGITRFHRIEHIEGLEQLGYPNCPTIFIANHQNGLMDPLVLCSLRSPHQIHWLTRADIFYKRVARALLFAFNQMPIYRQRDRLADARERNERIFEICAKRLEIGAAVGLFPEGNHRDVKSLRLLRRGVVDMVNQALRLNPNLKSLRLVPVGIDYEEMASLRRRLTYRIGPPIPVADLIDEETGQVSPGDLLVRVHEALDSLMVNIQPESHYDALLPYVRALRTTESPDWSVTKTAIQRLNALSAEQLEAVQNAYTELQNTPEFQHHRPEDLGTRAEQLRQSPWWLWPLAPAAILGGLCSWPLSKAIESQAHKRVKDPCFISTFKVSIGMFLFPLYWLALAWPLAWLVTGVWGGWPVVAGYLFNLIGSRVAGWWYGSYLDWRGARRARALYANAELAQRWNTYLSTIENAPVKPSSAAKATAIISAD